MLLTKPSFVISFSKKQVMDATEHLLKENNWSESDYRFSEVILKYVPYWLFSFDVFVEKDSQQQKIVSETKKGFISLNASTRELDESVAKIAEKIPPKKILEPKITEFEVIRSTLNENEVKKIASIRISEKLRLSRENIIITDLRKIFFPEWLASIEVKGHKLTFIFDAVQGNILLKPSFPEKGLSWEQTAEKTLTELKEPGNWLKYSVNFLNKIFSHSIFKSLVNELMYNNQLKIVLLLALVILFILVSFGLV